MANSLMVHDPFRVQSLVEMIAWSFSLHQYCQIIKKSNFAFAFI